MMDELRTPSPLRDVDFTAVRARVRAEIARRKQRTWFWPALRFATAALLVALAFGLTLARPERKPHVPAAPVIASHPDPAPQPEPVPQPQSYPEPEPVKPVRHARAARQAKDPMTIHIQTADPDIRIIWIVNPSIKEES
jgi:hypothetical protein